MGRPKGRKTRFWLPARATTRRDSHPQGSDERFPRCLLHHFLLPKAFLAQDASLLFSRAAPEEAEPPPHTFADTTLSTTMATRTAALRLTD